MSTYQELLRSVPLVARVPKDLLADIIRTMFFLAVTVIMVRWTVATPQMAVRILFTTLVMIGTFLEAACLGALLGRHYASSVPGADTPSFWWWVLLVQLCMILLAFAVLNLFLPLAERQYWLCFFEGAGLCLSLLQGVLIGRYAYPPLKVSVEAKQNLYFSNEGDF